MTTRAAKPVQRPPLTQQTIASAALAILDSEGRAAFSLRNVAKRLGVSAPSLYTHVDGLDALIDLIHKQINSEIDVTLIDNPDHRVGLADFARSYRGAYIRHSDGAALAIGRASQPSALRVYNALATCLTGMGVPPDAVLPLMVPLDHMILGSAIIPFAPVFPAHGRVRALGFPGLADSIKSSGRTRQVDNRGFEIGLAAWIDAVYDSIPR